MKNLSAEEMQSIEGGCTAPSNWWDVGGWAAYWSCRFWTAVGWRT